MKLVTIYSFFKLGKEEKQVFSCRSCHIQGTYVCVYVYMFICLDVCACVVLYDIG